MATNIKKRLYVHFLKCFTEIELQQWPFTCVQLTCFNRQSYLTAHVNFNVWMAIYYLIHTCKVINKISTKYFILQRKINATKTFHFVEKVVCMNCILKNLIYHEIVKISSYIYKEKCRWKRPACFGLCALLGKILWRMLASIYTRYMGNKINWKVTWKTNNMHLSWTLNKPLLLCTLCVTFLSGFYSSSYEI